MNKLLCLTLILFTVYNVVSSDYGFERLGRKRIHQEPPPPPTPPNARDVQTRWITQRLNNFDKQDTRVWNMRYMVNNEYFEPGGPIFIYVGGEWTISAGWLQSGHMHDMARDMHGIMFYTEHRYYGESHPTPDLSNENLQYLTIDQALEDLAHFIEYVHRSYSGVQDSGVILVGGSYSATMVAWFRQKYPHLVNGSWASSAPLLAKLDFVEYKEVVGESIRLVGGEACYDRIERAFTEMEGLLTTQANIARITEYFNICEPLTVGSQLDIWNFFASVTDEFAGVVQYHSPGDIEGICNLITSPTITDDIQAVANFITGGSSFCFNSGYSYFVDYYRDTLWENNSGAMRQWMYQTCAEYGWYQTSGSTNQPFGSSFPVELSVQQCIDLYNNTFTASHIDDNIDRVNIIYGGMNPAVTNVFFTQGQLDPWRPMGIQGNFSEAAPGVVIPMASHTQDLYSMSPNDHPDMTAAKEQITELVREWLGLN